MISAKLTIQQISARIKHDDYEVAQDLECDLRQLVCANKNEGILRLVEITARHYCENSEYLQMLSVFEGYLTHEYADEIHKRMTRVIDDLMYYQQVAAAKLACNIVPLSIRWKLYDSVLHHSELLHYLARTTPISHIHRDVLIDRATNEGLNVGAMVLRSMRATSMQATYI
jgi:hypothetical protein